MKVDVYDVDDFSERAVVEQNLIGSVEFRMDQLFFASNKTLSLEIKS